MPITPFILIAAFAAVPGGSARSCGGDNDFRTKPWPAINPECDANIDLNHLSMGNARVELLAKAIIGSPDSGGVSKVTGLLLGNNMISAAGAESIATLLKGRPKNKNKITMVEMAHNFVGDAGAASLADCIAAKKSNLFLLDVEDNGIGLAGIQSVAAAAMGQHAVIRALNLASNEVGDAGAVALAEAVATINSTLRILWLQHTGIGDVGVAAIAQAAMSDNSMLSVLHLHGNDVSDVGAAALAEAIASENSKLVDIFLGWNRITAAGAALLARAIESPNSKVKQVALYGNGIGYVGLAPITRALAMTAADKVEAEANPEAADAAREAAAELALVEERRLKDDAAAELALADARIERCNDRGMLGPDGATCVCDATAHPGYIGTGCAHIRSDLSALLLQKLGEDVTARVLPVLDASPELDTLAALEATGSVDGLFELGIAAADATMVMHAVVGAHGRSEL